MTSEPLPTHIREIALRAMLRAPEDLAYPLVTDLQRRPLTMDVIFPQPLGRPQKIASGLLLAIALLFLTLGVLDTNLTLAVIAVFFSALIGVIFWISAARASMHWRITWHDDAVEVMDQRWGRNSHWSAPYSEFRGIALRDSRIPPQPSRSHRTGRPIQVAELVHENPQKTLLLASRDPSPDVETRAQTNARHIGVPFLGPHS